MVDAPSEPPSPNGQRDADPLVSIAFALGWQMSEFALLSADGVAPELQREFPDLEAYEQTEILSQQAVSGVAKLKPLIVGAGLTAPDAQAFVEQCKFLAGADLIDIIHRFHIGLRATLSAADSRTGKAYGVGKALGDMTLAPQDLAAVLHPDSAWRSAAAIRDLSSVFPANTGHPVAMSLEAWSRAWGGYQGSDGGSRDPSRARDLFQQQGHVWRVLLSAETRATDLLIERDYLNAGEYVFVGMAQLTARYWRRYWPGYFLIVLIVAIVAVMFAINNAVSVITGATAIAAALGLSFRGRGRPSLAVAADRIEAPYWNTELDRIIYSRITPEEIQAVSTRPTTDEMSAPRGESPSG